MAKRKTPLLKQGASKMRRAGIEPWEDLPPLAVRQPIPPGQVERWRELVKLPPAQFQALLPEQWRNDIANALGTALYCVLYLEPTAAQWDRLLRETKKAAWSPNPRRDLRRAVKIVKSSRRNALDENRGLVRAYFNPLIFHKLRGEKGDLKSDICLLARKYHLAPTAVWDRLIRSRKVMQDKDLNPVDLAADAIDREFFGQISIKDFRLPGRDYLPESG